MYLMLEKQVTQDGSITFFNSEYQEAYHSIIGAYSEALHKHVLATQIPALAVKQCEIKILDLCFGLGYNSAVAIKEAIKANPKIILEIVGLENDLDIINQIPQIQYPSELEEIHLQFSNVIKSSPEMLCGRPCFSLYTDNYSLDLIMGDARLSLLMLEDNYFDAIFFDPFSPKVCPELWEPDFIQAVVNKAKSQSYISTYSSSRLAKDGFLKAGCEIQEGPKLNRRNGGVLALKL